MKWLVAVLVVLGLLVVADRVGESVAERTLADQLEQELGSRPDVEIGGFPFLTQALRGRYEQLRADAPSAVQGGVTLHDVRSTLSGVHVPLSDAVRGDVTEVPVDALEASGTVSYDDLEVASGVDDVQLEADPGGGVRVTGSFRVLGGASRPSRSPTVTLDGDTLVVTAQPGRGRHGRGAVSAALQGRLDLRIPVPELPYGLQLSSVRTGPDGVAVAGSQRADVVVRP